jgi:amino acid adenylation domain-containing protein
LSSSQTSPIPELDRSIAALVAERAVEQPGAVALEDGELRLTYAELDAAGAAIAAGLRESGVGAEEPVGVCLPRSWQSICAFLGIARAGAAYLPISPAYPAERQRALLELAGARLALSDAGHDQGLPGELRRLEVEALAGTRADGVVPIAPGGDRLAYVLFTSGSTGTPKGVEVTHRNLVHLLRSDTDMVPRPDDVVLQVVPLEFDVSGLEIWGALLNGARLVIAPRGRPDPRRLGSLIAARGVTFLGISTGVLHELVGAALPDLGGLRLAVAVGDVLSPKLAGELLSAHPKVRLLNGYGPTEATIAASSHEVLAAAGPVPIGRALPGYRLHVLDESLSPVPEGEPGELWIGGGGVARGYRNDPDRTAASFRDDPVHGGTMYRSGDRVKMREDGELLFLGRFDDQVKISSQRVEPGEVEQALAGHPGLRQAAVVAREDVPGHKRLVGYAVPRPGADPTPGELRDHLARQLPSFMVPSSIVLLDGLPLNERGKVDRAALPAPGRAGSAAVATDPRVDPVAKLMAEVLRLESVGPEENFFELGGTSLLAIQLIGRLRLRLQVDVDIGAIFEAPSPAALVERLDRGAAGGSPPLPALRSGPRQGTAPVSAAQRRAWLFGRINPESIAYQFAAIFRFEGSLDETALEGAMADLMGRHEIFRTSFEERDGEPIQVIHGEAPVPLEKLDLRDQGEAAWPRLVRDRVRTRIDPGRAPLLRWTLLRLGDSRWALVQVEHHLIHDGWSFAVLAGELAELYSARAEGRDPALAPVEVQFQDYARWERAVHGSEAIGRQLDHWKLSLDPDPPLLELPTDRPRPARESFAGGSVRRRLEPGLADELRAIAHEENATLFMITLAAFYAQLQRYSGSDDVQVGSGFANRHEPSSERLIGMALNTVALRCDLDGDPTVRELLGRVRRVALDAYANADAPFDKVVEAIKPPRDPRRSPLIQTLFSFHDAPRPAAGWMGLRTKLVQVVPNGTAKADLNVIGIDDGDSGLTFVWEHSDLFTDASADRLAGHHLALLTEFAANPDARLSELDLLDSEQRLELSSWNAVDTDYNRQATLPELVWGQAERDPGAIAVLDGAERLSYGDLVAKARAVAGSLRARGVGRGDLVGVLLARSANSIVAQLGVLAAGAAYVPLDPLHPSPRIARALADAGVALVLTEPAPAPRLPAGVEALEIDVAAAGVPLEGLDAGAEDLAYVIYTSGSTGEPKGVEVTHRNVVRLVDDPGFADLGRGTVMLHAASPAFDATTLEMWGPLANGGTVATLGERPSPDAVATAIAAHGVTTLWLTAGLFHELVDRRLDCLASVRHVLAGGDVLSPHHVSRALAALPPEGRLSNGYGPTETTTFALTQELRPGDRVDERIPLGRPIQGTVCDVLDTAGRALPVGVPGELWIGGDGVARGYRNDPELTAARFQADPGRPGQRRYRSGDRVRRRPDGALEFLGRLDRQVKVRGVRVEPAEVEEVLRGHPALRDVAVVPFDRAQGDLALAAYVVAAAGSAAPDSAALREHAAERLPAAMVPAAWVALSQLPLTANGKLDRDRLPPPGREHLARVGGGEPASDAERLVTKAFEKILDVQPLGVEDDFFALGGHSLLAVALFAELERVTGRRLPLATIFEASTPRALAACVGADAPASRWDNLVALKPQGTRPPLFVVSAGDGNLVGFAPLARHLSAEQPLYGLQPSGLDGRRPLDRGIEEMASRYLEKLREVQPRGPYLLAGRCNGATVAYEMAQRLRAEGEEVPLLATLDSDPPPAGPHEIVPGVAYDAMMETAWLRARRNGEQAPDPDGPGGPAALAAWLRAALAPGVSRYLYEAWRWRADLSAAWPDPLGADAADFSVWAWDHGQTEMHLAAALLQPAVTDGCRIPGGHAWDWAMAAAWEELGREPADPLSTVGWRMLRQRLLEPVGDDGAMNRYLLSAWRRPDLSVALPEPLAGGGAALCDWAWREGVDQGLTPQLLPPPPAPLSDRRRRELRLLPLRRRASRAGAVAIERARLLSAEAKARAIEAVERRLSRPLPGARWRIERRVLAAARQARSTYRARPWPGKVVLVTSTEFVEKPSYAAWDLRAGDGVELRPLPVGHVEMLREPGAELLARCLDECIEEALRR